MAYPEVLYQSVLSYGVHPYYTVFAGMVFFHGCFKKQTGSFSYNEYFGTMPVGTRPYGGWHVFPVAGTEGNSVPIQVEASGGMLAKTQYADTICMDGVFYRVA